MSEYLILLPVICKECRVVIGEMEATVAVDGYGDERIVPFRSSIRRSSYGKEVVMTHEEQLAIYHALHHDLILKMQRIFEISSPSVGVTDHSKLVRIHELSTDSEVSIGTLCNKI